MDPAVLIEVSMPGLSFLTPALYDQVHMTPVEAQRLRVRRLAFGVWMSIGVAALYQLMALVGMLTQRIATWGIAQIVVLCLLFITIFLTGANRRFRDPSLTIAQGLVATMNLAWVGVHATDAGRLMVWLLVPLPFVFACFRYGSRTLLKLAFVHMSIVFAMSLWAKLAAPLVHGNSGLDHGHAARLLPVEFFALALVLVSLSLLGGQISDLRRRTRIERAISYAVITRLHESVVVVDSRDRILYANPSARTTLCIDTKARRLPELSSFCRIVDEPSLGNFLQEVEQQVPPGDPDGKRMATLFESAASEPLRVTLETRNGTKIQAELTLIPVRTERGLLDGRVLVFRDVTEQSRLVDELRHAATHDEVTGLLNRRGFIDRLNELGAAQRMPGRAPCALVIDLDQFKVVNDACGHQAGDDLLRKTASMMCAIAPLGASVARLGGDEFGIALPDTPLAQAEALARRLLHEFAEMRFGRDGRVFRIGASIGVAQAANAPGLAETLLTNADSACFLAKERGRNRMQTYRLGDEEVARHRMDVSWFTQINDAIDRDRFELFGQRMIGARPGAEPDEAVEILLRMRSEEGRLISPAAFLPVAERFDLIAALDRRVISMAFETLRRAARSGATLPSVAINLSASSLRDADLLPYISARMADAGLPPSMITFELTETAAILDEEKARSFFTGIRALGARVALDDVGSGFNSFANLRRLPLDQIKIDGAYVRTVCDNPIDRVFVESMQRIASLLGIETVAEFVENEEVSEALTAIGVDYLQGYGVHRPEPLALALGVPGIE